MYWDQALELVKKEYERAAETHPQLHSPHEGLAVIEDQFEDLKKQVFLPRYKRNPTEMQKEAIQVAAMAIRFIIDCTLNKNIFGKTVVNPAEGHSEDGGVSIIQQEKE